MQEKVGTFLIRFSETNIEQSQRADIFGYVAVAVKEIHPVNSKTNLPTLILWETCKLNFILNFVLILGMPV